MKRRNYNAGFRMPRNAFGVTGDPLGPGASVGQAQADGIMSTISNPSPSKLGTLAAVGIGAGSALIGGLGGLFGGGGSSQESGLNLPPELEFTYLQDSFQNLEKMKADYQKAQDIAKLYEEKYNILDQQINGLIPPTEAMQKLSANTLSLVNNLGASVQDALKNGLLHQSDINDLNALKELESADLRDPVYDNERKIQRQKMQSDLARQGASPAETAQALANFDNESTLGSFQRTEQLRASRAGLISNRLGLQSGLRNDTMNQALGATNAMMGAQGQYANFIGQKTGITGQAQQGALSMLGVNQGLRGETQSTFAQLGEFDFSKNAKNFLKSGLYQNEASMSPTQFKAYQEAQKQPLTAQQQAQIQNYQDNK